MSDKPSRLDRSFWDGKRVMVTGHTGFKGCWLTIWLEKLGCQIIGLSLKPLTDPALFDLANISARCDNHFVDIRDLKKVIDVVKKTQPEVVFHLAAQALVYEGYSNPVETIATNTMGTANILEAIRLTASVRTAVMVTTDKVYHNNECLKPFKENDTIGGRDPYSASKAASELIIDCYRNAFFNAQGVAVASARAGNVIGGGDWAAERLVPDAIRAWSDKQPLAVRYPEAIRPWQHVLEPLHGYLVLAQYLTIKPELATAFNFGPDFKEVASVRRVIELAQKTWGNASVSWDNRVSQLYESGTLRLDSQKSSNELGVQPIWNLEETVQRTIAWYRKQAQGRKTIVLCVSDIKDYEAKLDEKNA